MAPTASAACWQPLGSCWDTWPAAWPFTSMYLKTLVLLKCFGEASKFTVTYCSRLPIVPQIASIIKYKMTVVVWPAAGGSLYGLQAIFRAVQCCSLASCPHVQDSFGGPGNPHFRLKFLQRSEEQVVKEKQSSGILELAFSICELL